MDLTTAPEPDDAGFPPIACSLDEAAMPGRHEEWQAVLAFVAERSPIPSGLRLTMERDAPLGEIARLAFVERECCAFFAFAITVDGRGVALEVTAPPDAQAIVDEHFGSRSA